MAPSRSISQPGPCASLQPPCPNATTTLYRPLSACLAFDFSCILCNGTDTRTANGTAESVCVGTGGGGECLERSKWNETHAVWKVWSMRKDRCGVSWDDRGLSCNEGNGDQNQTCFLDSAGFLDEGQAAAASQSTGVGMTGDDGLSSSAATRTVLVRISRLVQLFIFLR